MTLTTHRVDVPVATGWTSPAAPRDEDAPATADAPDVAAWLAGLTVEGRLGLHDRTLTQLVEGEPVQVVEEAGEWVRVAALWQPTLEDAPGYLCWVRRAHLREPRDDDPEQPGAQLPRDPRAILDLGHGFIGLPYLWGGTSPLGLDCSGLVHHVHRQAGVVVPRDADAQADATVEVARGSERPGDLYFFGRSRDRITHVGLVTAVGEMLHSPEDTADRPGAGTIEHTRLSPSLADSLVHVGRIPL